MYPKAVGYLLVDVHAQRVHHDIHQGPHIEVEGGNAFGGIHPQQRILHPALIRVPGRHNHARLQPRGLPNQPLAVLDLHRLYDKLAGACAAEGVSNQNLVKASRLGVW